MTEVKDIKALPYKHKAVVAVLRVGKENATLLSDIMILTDIQCRRQAHAVIEQLINDYGLVIGASRMDPFRGYYIPANQIEFIEIADTFKSTIESMEKRYYNLIENYNNMGA